MFQHTQQPWFLPRSESARFTRHSVSYAWCCLLILTGIILTGCGANESSAPTSAAPEWETATDLVAENTASTEEPGTLFEEAQPLPAPPLQAEPTTPTPVMAPPAPSNAAGPNDFARSSSQAKRSRPSSGFGGAASRSVMPKPAQTRATAPQAMMSRPPIQIDETASVDEAFADELSMDFDDASASGTSIPLPKNPSIASNEAAASQTRSVSQPTTVEVFYATDRNRVAAIATGDFWKVFGWAIRLGCLAVLASIMGLVFRRKSLQVTAASALLGGLVLGYGGWIEWQGRTRLDAHQDVRYTHDIRRLANNDSTQDLLDYGRCLVNLPPKHETGLVEAPSLTRFEFTEDPEKHVILERIIRSDQPQFFTDLNERLAAGNQEALVFVHGYNVSFGNAVKRTAQISWDVKFEGTPVCYSWPSHGGLEDYTRDMANADWSVVHLQKFLNKLFEESDATKVHLIAHSMGNRVLLQALDRMSLQRFGPGDSPFSLASHQKSSPLFGNIVLAAPDVSANDFRQRYSTTIQTMAEHVTLYASSRDRALMVSAGVHGHDRAGLAGTGIVVVDGIDTIDVSHVDSSLIGHSYYGDNPELIDDLKAIIGRSEPTSMRSWLERVDTAANRFYWKFRH